jgi:hypothetical protein
MDVVLCIFVVATAVVLILCSISERRESFADITEQCIDPKTGKVRTLKKPDTKEVFFIQNKYTFDEAKAVCSLINAELATYEQLNDAYTKGANWCAWGWMADGSVGYPVQQEFWEYIETVNSGFCGPNAGVHRMANADKTKSFGVMCYGIKPTIEKKYSDANASMKKKRVKEGFQATAVPKQTENGQSINGACAPQQDPTLQQRIYECQKKKAARDRKKWEREQKKNMVISYFDGYNQVWSGVAGK